MDFLSLNLSPGPVINRALITYPSPTQSELGPDLAQAGPAHYHPYAKPNHFMNELRYFKGHSIGTQIFTLPAQRICFFYYICTLL